MSTTNVLISGANRGLGRAFVEQYLARPDQTVIGTVRDVNSAAANELHAIPAATGSKLILVKIEYTSTTDAYDAVKQLEAQGITRLDIVIANVGFVGQQGPMETIDPKGLAEVYIINAVGPAVLFLALKPLLDKSASPKWMSLSTGLASFQDMEKYDMFRGFPYGASKVALNYFTKSIHLETNVIAFATSPGFLPTDMGKNSAAFFGFENPPFMDLDANVKSLVGLLDNATREKYSGQFVNFDGELIGW